MLEIQKLATELGLNCITTYKLDALKAVCRRNESDTLSTSNCVDSSNNSAISTSNEAELHVEKMACSSLSGLSSTETCNGNGGWNFFTNSLIIDFKICLHYFFLVIRGYQDDLSCPFISSIPQFGLKLAVRRLKSLLSFPCPCHPFLFYES